MHPGLFFLLRSFLFSDNILSVMSSSRRFRRFGGLRKIKSLSIFFFMVVSFFMFFRQSRGFRNVLWPWLGFYGNSESSELVCRNRRKWFPSLSDISDKTLTSPTGCYLCEGFVLAVADRRTSMAQNIFSCLTAWLIWWLDMSLCKLCLEKSHFAAGYMRLGDIWGDNVVVLWVFLNL